MKVAVVGATGMVGQVMLQVLAERNFPLTELFPVASHQSKGKEIKYKGNKYPVYTIEEVIEKKPDIALFSAGGETSKKYAPLFVEKGTTVIDNSSAWRMDPDVPLVVPEVNGSVLQASDKLIANPNCSTIQLVMVLHPLHKLYGIKRVVISTYQSVTGSGKGAVDQLEGEISGNEVSRVYPYQIFKNALPQCDVFDEDNYTKEELKLSRETPKIMGDNSLKITATAVRVPVQGGHSESVNIEFLKPYDLEKIKQSLSQTKGILLQDDPSQNLYPMPLYAEGKNEVFVGRIRPDHTQENSLNLWIVADNLRKGAATNAVQIAELCVR